MPLPIVGMVPVYRREGLRLVQLGSLFVFGGPDGAWKAESPDAWAESDGPQRLYRTHVPGEWLTQGFVTGEIQRWSTKSG
jgi:hypothetical protein